jgi:hypothetical protein
MTSPEQALARAQASAAERRAEGAYAEARPSRAGPPAAEGAELKLYQWAFIEPDLSRVRSLRRAGAPITALKRLLLRLLVQYHVQLIGDQTRFNVMLLGYVSRLEMRITELEARLDECDGDQRTPAS